MAHFRATLSRWWNGISLRAKVTGVTVVLLTVGLLVAGVGSSAVLRTYLLERVDSQIQGVRAGGLNGTVNLDQVEEFGDPRGGLNPYYIAVLSSDGEVLYDNLSAEDADKAPRTDELTLARIAMLETGNGITLHNEAKTVEWRVIPYPVSVQHESD